MDYTLAMGGWSSVFAVPTSLVDKYLKLAGKDQLKVILWVLRNNGKAFNINALSAELGISEDSAEDAVSYWVESGLLSQSGGSLTPSQEAVPENKSAPAEVPAAAAASQELPVKKTRMPRPDGLFLAQRINESDEIRFMIQEAESTLGKTLSPALSSALIGVHDDYGLPVEVIVMIVHYAKDIGRTSTAYIEAVAKDWAQDSIFTLDAAEEKLKALSKKRQAWKKVETAAGISPRSPTQKEGELACRWVYEWRMSSEMIAAAYERCADNTGKFSSSYINKILDSWQSQGITSLQALSEYESKRAETEKKAASYNIDDLESMSLFNPLEK